MSDVDFTDAAANWGLHTLAAGAVVFGLGWAWVRRVADPARRRQLAAWVVRGGVVAAVLGLFPAWLVLPVLPREEARLTDPVPAVPPSTVRILPPPPFPEPHDSAAPVASDESWVVAEPEPVGLPCEPAPPEEPAAEPLPASRTGLNALHVTGGDVPAGIGTGSTRPAATAAAPASPWRGIGRLVFLAYAAGVVVTALPLLLGAVALARLRRKGEPATGCVQAVFDAIAAELGVRARVLVVERLHSPVCFGLFRPVVLLPRELADRATESELRWVFAHELDHLRRGDPWTGWWVGLARAVYFVVPWFWPVRRELALAQEYLADAAAAAAAGRVEEYAAFLVRLSGGPGGRRHPVGAAAVRAPKSDLYRRVTMLLEANGRRGTRVSRWWTAGVAAGALGTAAVLSGVGLSQERDDPKPRTTERKPDEPRQGRREERRPADEPRATERRVVEVEVVAGQPGQPAAVPPEVAALRKAVDEAKRRGADVTEIEKQLNALEKSLGGRAVVVGPAVRVAPADPAGRPVPLTATRPDPKAQAEIELLRAKAAELKALGKAREADELAVQAEKLAKQQADLKRAVVGGQGGGGGVAVGGQGAGPVFAGQASGGGMFGGVSVEPRLGMQVDAIPPALGVQLDLPKGQGVVVSALFRDFPADKAGVKTGDILLELNGKPVSDNPSAFVRTVGDLKTGDKADVVVLRKGKKETIKGIEVPEARRGASGPGGVRGAVEVEGVPLTRPGQPFPPGVPAPPAVVRPPSVPQPPAVRGGLGGGRGQSMSVEVRGDAFTIKAEDDGVSYEITGTAAGRKPDATRILITDGKDKVEATSVEKVPAKYRETVEKLLDTVRIGR